jgi:aldose 1-epimerase
MTRPEIHPFPTGTQHKLQHGDYSATVTEVGATLRSLTHAGRPLIRNFDADQLMPLHRGAVLAPWPNRVADGKYSFGGNDYQLPLTEPARHHAIHGLACFLGWEPVSASSSAVSLTTRIWPQLGYPFRLDLFADYALDQDGLHWSLRAVNSGDRSAPYGCSIHPYLVADPDVALDQWTLSLPAENYLSVDDRLLPTGLVPVGGTQFDFRTPVVLGTRQLDQALAGFGAGLAGATLTAPSGRGVRLTWDASKCGWAQVFTCDRPDPETNRSGLAIEPMTCPTNAFNSGTDLIHLAPGESHQTSWHLTAI